MNTSQYLVGTTSVTHDAFVPQSNVLIRGTFWAWEHYFTCIINKIVRQTVYCHNLCHHVFRMCNCTVFFLSSSNHNLHSTFHTFFQSLYYSLPPRFIISTHFGVHTNTISNPKKHSSFSLLYLQRTQFSLGYRENRTTCGLLPYKIRLT